MAEKVQYIAFFEEYFDYAEDLTGEQYKTFMLMIRDLRFKGIDILPQDIEDKDLRLAWRSVRPCILKSSRNARAYEKKQKDTIQPNEEFDVETGEVKPAVSCHSQPAVTEEVKQPQEGQKEAQIEAYKPEVVEDIKEELKEPVNGLKSSDCEVMTLDDIMTYSEPEEEPTPTPELTQEEIDAQVKAKQEAKRLEFESLTKQIATELVDYEKTKGFEPGEFSDMLDTLVNRYGAQFPLRERKGLGKAAAAEYRNAA